jgi:hypothetical protein
MDESREKHGVVAGGRALAPGDIFDELLTPAEVADLLKVPLTNGDQRAVRRALDEIGCPLVILTKLTWRVRRSTLMRCIAAAEAVEGQAK